MDIAPTQLSSQQYRGREAMLPHGLGSECCQCEGLLGWQLVRALTCTLWPRFPGYA